MLTKHRTAMKVAEEQPFSDYVTFQAHEEETGVMIDQYVMDGQDWVDMGNPDTVTVTVEPGDHLNE